MAAPKCKIDFIASFLERNGKNGVNLSAKINERKSVLTEIYTWDVIPLSGDVKR